MSNETTTRAAVISAVVNISLMIVLGILVINNSRIRQNDQRQFDARFDDISSVTHRILWSSNLFSAVRVDHAGIVTRANPRAIDRYGLTVGSSIETIMEPDALEKHRDGFSEQTPRRVSTGRHCAARDVEGNLSRITLDVWTETDGATAVWVDE